jgi:RNA polymerase sigma factor (sigma-70 family)
MSYDYDNNYDDTYEKYYNLIYKFCLSKLYNDQYNAEEATTETFIVLYNKWNIIHKDNILNWLYKTAGYCIKVIKKKYIIDHKTFISLDLYEDNLFADMPESIDINPESVYQIKLMIKNKLDIKYQMLFQYRYIDNKTLNDIVSLTGIPYSTLRYRLKETERLSKVIIKKSLDKSVC